MTNIEDVKVNDKVLSYDQKSGTYFWDPVVIVNNHEAFLGRSETIKLVLESYTSEDTE